MARKQPAGAPPKVVQIRIYVAGQVVELEIAGDLVAHKGASK